MTATMPVFPVMFDLAKIIQHAGNHPEKEGLESHLNALASAEYGALTSSDAILFLMEHFGPNSKNPCVFRQVERADRSIHMVSETTGSEVVINGYWAFTSNDPNGKSPDPSDTIIIRATLTAQSPTLILRDFILGSSNQSFILLFHYECCAGTSDDGKLPFSVVISNPERGIFTVTHSSKILSDHHDLALATFFRINGDNPISVAALNDCGFKDLVEKASSADREPKRTGFWGSLRNLIR